MASRMFCSIFSMVAPVATQPRRVRDARRRNCSPIFQWRRRTSRCVLRDRYFIVHGPLRRPIGLWALSVHGIYRTCEALGIDVPIASDPVDTTPCGTDPTLLHHKYQLPAECFAYVPDSNDPRSWKLPYRLADGGIDQRRLPKAIQSILSNYRGTRVGGIPEAAMREVLIRLARAATMAGHLPANSTSAPTYRQLAQTLEQLRIAL